MAVRRVGFITMIVLACLVLGGLLLVGPIPRQSLEDRSFFHNMANQLDTLTIDRHSGDTLLAGWSAVDITPRNPVMLAGYGIRGPVDSIHDRLEAKAVVIDNGNFSVAVVSMDLLLFPGSVMDSLMAMARAGRLPVQAVYPAAIHTHNAFGHCEQSPAIELAFGKYRESIVHDLIEHCAKAISTAHEQREGASLGYIKTRAPAFVVNRLDRDAGKTDDYLRGIAIEQKSGRQCILLSYAAHPVVLDTRVLAISRDYPGYLTDYLKDRAYCDEAVFMAGSVGSHTVPSSALSNFERAEAIGHGLARILAQADPERIREQGPTLAFQQVAVALPDPQLRISRRLALRSWLFRALIGELRADITVLQVGNILLLGMPCDFSGEIAVRDKLDSLAATQGLHLMITSFNGDYVGYVSDDRYYDTSTSEEVRLMNWTGPNMGSYFSFIIKTILHKI